MQIKLMHRNMDTLVTTTGYSVPKTGNAVHNLSQRVV